MRIQHPLHYPDIMTQINYSLRLTLSLSLVHNAQWGLFTRLDESHQETWKLVNTCYSVLMNTRSHALIFESEDTTPFTLPWYYDSNQLKSTTDFSPTLVSTVQWDYVLGYLRVKTNTSGKTWFPTLTSSYVSVVRVVPDTTVKHKVNHLQRIEYSLFSQKN